MGIFASSPCSISSHFSLSKSYPISFSPSKSCPISFFPIKIVPHFFFLHQNHAHQSKMFHVSTLKTFHLLIYESRKNLVKRRQTRKTSSVNYLNSFKGRSSPTKQMKTCLTFITMGNLKYKYQMTTGQDRGKRK